MYLNILVVKSKIWFAYNLKLQFFKNKFLFQHFQQFRNKWEQSFAGYDVQQNQN